MLAPAELKEIHPLGKSPVITVEADTLAQPLVLAESGLIVEYLVDHFGPHLVPKKWSEGKEGQVGGESEEWIRYRYYMHYAEGSFMILLVVALLVGSMSATIMATIMATCWLC
jgi:glutathione S-transferase